MQNDLKLNYDSAGQSLRNLTHAQIDALVSDYYSKEYTVNKLTQKYHLKIYANQLFQELPFRIVEKRCIYDDHYLETRLTSRYAPKYAAKHELFCPQCHHHDVDDCHCQNCLKDSQDTIKDKKYAALQRLVKKQAQKPLVDIQDIDTKDIFYLNILIEQYGNEKGGYIGGLFQYPRPLLPSKDKDDDARLIERLLNDNILTIADSSPIEAFIFDDDYNITRYYPLGVNCNLHIKGDGMTDSFKDNSIRLFLDVGTMSKDKQLFSDLNYYAASQECIDYLVYELNQIGFALPSDDEKIFDVLDYLLHHFSEKQIFYLFHKEVMNAAYYYLAKNTSKQQAADYMLNSLKDYGKLIVNKGWNVYERSWPKKLERSALTHALFNYVLRIFIPSEYNFYPENLF